VAELSVALDAGGGGNPFRSKLAYRVGKGELEATIISIACFDVMRIRG
jgi:hypothetical protein